jgi:hypothetical protein
MKLDNRIFVFDDIIDKPSQKQIQQILFNSAEWTFCVDVTNPNNKQQRPGFAHYFVKDKQEVSKYNQNMMMILNNASSKINFKRKDVLQGRSFLQLPLNLIDKSIDAPHVDADQPHLVVLYYVNDSDGETVIYENKFEGYDKVPMFKDLKEKQRVTPKAGRVVLFDGYYWHTSCQPQYNTRCIINYNLI